MKRLFIIHRWGANPDSDWYPWLKNHLKYKFNIEILKMPNTDNPVIDDWVSYLTLKVGKVDERTNFVGHSIGCQAILRYLEKQDIKTEKVVLVAPWIKLQNINKTDKKIAEPWLTRPINWEKVKDKAQEITAIFSNNDPFVDLEQSSFFESNLNAKIIIEDHKGHITGEEGFTKLETVLKEFI